MGRQAIFSAISGLLIGGIVFAFLLSPRVTDWSPQTTSYSAWEPISITFNRPVSTSNPTESMTISPGVAGELSLSGKRLLFQLSEPLAAGQAYTVKLGNNLRGKNGLPLLGVREWSFVASHPRLIFLRQTNGKDNLWLQEDGQEKQLTQEKQGLWDYHVAPKGQGIIFSTIDDDETMDLIQLTSDGQRRMLLDCQDSQCRAGRWQPNGNLLAFERQRLGESREQTEVWLLNTEGGELRPAHDSHLLAEPGFESLTSTSPRWSADGRYLSYFKPDARVLIVKDFSDNSTKLIPANLEIMGDWSPHGYQLAYTELAFGQQGLHEHGDEAGDVITHTNTTLYSHVVVTDLAEEESRDLSRGQEVDDGVPTWHPNGHSITTGRTFTGSGRQMWLLPTGDGQSRPLTDDPYNHHTSPVWSPDGKRLAFMQVSLAVDGGGPNIWILDGEQEEMTLAAENAFMPNWWP